MAVHLKVFAQLCTGRSLVQELTQEHSSNGPQYKLSSYIYIITCKGVVPAIKVPDELGASGGSNTGDEWSLTSASLLCSRQL